MKLLRVNGIGANSTRLMMVILCITYSGFLSSALSFAESFTKEQQERADEETFRVASQYASIFDTQISAPLNRLLLIRDGDQICAIRFTKFKRMWDRGNATTFTSAEENMYAEYDWYYVKNGFTDASSSDVVMGHAEVRRKPTYGIGRLNFQLGGNRSVKCGPFEQAWLYPISISMQQEFPIPSQGRRHFAPTAWHDWRDVNLNEPRLRWFQYGELQSELLIPIKDLPQ